MGGLGLQTSNGGGEFKQYIAYDAKAGRAFRNDRAQAADGSWTSNRVDITKDLTIIADLANVRVGWICYTAGSGPVKVLTKLGTAMPPRPEGVNDQGKPTFKQGFEFDLLLAKSHGGGGIRELSSTAGCVIEAVDGLYDAYSAAPEAAQGQLPIVKMTDTVPVKSGQSQNYKPVFIITGWADRPAALNGTAATPDIAPAVTVSSTPAASTAVSSSDFG